MYVAPAPRFPPRTGGDEGAEPGADMAPGPQGLNVLFTCRYSRAGEGWSVAWDHQRRKSWRSFQVLPTLQLQLVLLDHFSRPCFDLIFTYVSAIPNIWPQLWLSYCCHEWHRGFTSKPSAVLLPFSAPVAHFTYLFIYLLDFNGNLCRLIKAQVSSLETLNRTLPEGHLTERLWLVLVFPCLPLCCSISCDMFVQFEQTLTHTHSHTCTLLFLQQHKTVVVKQEIYKEQGERTKEQRSVLKSTEKNEKSYWKVVCNFQVRKEDKIKIQCLKLAVLTFHFKDYF